MWRRKNDVRRAIRFLQNGVIEERIPQITEGGLFFFQIKMHGFQNLNIELRIRNHVINTVITDEDVQVVIKRGLFRKTVFNNILVDACHRRMICDLLIFSKLFYNCGVILSKLVSILKVKSKKLILEARYLRFSVFILDSFVENIFQ